VREPLVSVVAQWSACWFVGDYATVTSLKISPGAARNESDDGGWRLHRKAIAARSEPEALSRMTDRALDTDTRDLMLNDNDKTLIKALECRLVEDLVERLELAFGVVGGENGGDRRVRDPLANGGGVLATLVDLSGRDILSVALPCHVVVPHIKSTLSPSLLPQEAPKSLTTAFGNVPMMIEALVGSAQLTLAELADLSVGDVLVLDRAIGAPVGVTVLNSRHVFAQARVTQTDDDVALIF